jgi:hypothetical protein
MNIVKNSIFVIIGLVLSLVTLEVAVRMLNGMDFSLTTTLQSFETKGRVRSHLRIDKLLGWTLKESVSVPMWGGTLSTNEAGLRVVEGATAKPGKAFVLAAGCSATMGDEVSDEFSWPVLLEAKSGKKVINAGVSGYGLDQAYLRAEILLSQYQTEWIVLTIIPDSIFRALHNRRFGVPKPVFTVKNSGELELLPPRDQIDRARTLELLGYSHLMSFLIKRLSAKSYVDLGDDVMEHQNHLAISKGITDKFISLAQKNGARLMVVYLNPPREINFVPDLLYHPAALDPDLQYIKSKNLTFYDVKDDLLLEFNKDKNYVRSFYAPGWHFTPTGNSWFADRINATLAGQSNH